MGDYPTIVEVRRWAEAKDLPVSYTGPLPRGLIKAWDRTHPDRPYKREFAFCGTLAGYSRGCKCDRCRDAVAAGDRQRQRNRRDDREWDDGGAL